MRIFYSIFSTVMMALAFISCGGDDEPTPPPSPVENFTVTPATLTFNMDGGNQTFDVKSSVSPAVWSDHTDWCAVKQASSASGTYTYTVTVQPNKKAEERTATISVRVGTKTMEVHVTQEKYANVLTVTPEITPDINGMESKSKEWVRKIKVGWNLGNSLEAWYEGCEDTETSWGNPAATEDMIKAVKEAGFNAVRIPVRWFPHFTDDNATVDPTWMARVKEVVDYCIKNDLYVILNTHHETWLEAHPLKADQAEVKRKEMLLWKQIAVEFRDYDEHLVFSGTNEVNIDWKVPTAENYEVQNGFNQDFIEAVRSTGGKNYYRNLIIQTYSCNPRYGLSGLTMPADVVENRVIVEFHYYDPYDFCLAGKKFTWGSDAEVAEMKALFESTKAAWNDNGYGVVVGEFGCAESYKGTAADKEKTQADRKNYYTTIVSTARATGHALFLWDNNAFSGNEPMGFFDRKDEMKVAVPYAIDAIMEATATPYCN